MEPVPSSTRASSKSPRPMELAGMTEAVKVVVVVVVVVVIVHFANLPSIVNADYFIIATGSVPRKHDSVMVDREVILDSDHILHLKVLSYPSISSYSSRNKSQQQIRRILFLLCTVAHID
jgi:hypothetical protein